MASVLSILKRLEATTSRLEKEDILGEHADDPVLKEAFRLALDPLVNFYIKKIPEPGQSDGTLFTLTGALESLKLWFVTRKVRGGEATEYLARMLGQLDKDDREVLRRVIGRNLKCGVSDATVEKIWPDLKLSYPCMLVSPMNEKTKIKFPCIAQTKMDGMRFNAIVENGTVQYRSRAGKELDLFGVLDSDIMNLTTEQDYVLDGELLMVGGDGRPMDRKTGNGLLTKFQKGTGTAALAQQVRAVVWDIIPLFCFRKGVCSGVGYRDRLNMLTTEKLTRASIVTTHVVKNMEEAQALYQQKLLEGEEGLVLKDPNGPWENKRAKHQVKMKAELEADLYCAGVTAGTGKYQGKIGALECHSKGGSVVVCVGTGLDDGERACDPGEFIGKIVSVKYNALITDKKTGQKSLFLPVFVEIRDDKTQPDSL
jgi:ATP-dependent DNA ligase